MRTKLCHFPIWLISFCSFYRMARMKVTPKKERRGDRWVIQPREARTEDHQKREGGHPLQCTTHPQPESPHLHEGGGEEVGRGREVQVEEARWLEDVGRSPSSLHQPDSWPRWLQRPGHLIWRRSQSGGSSDLLWEAKPPIRNSSRLVWSRKTRKYQPGTVALWEIWQFPKEHWAPYQETSLLMASPVR